MSSCVLTWYDNILFKYQIYNKNRMGRRRTYRELELRNKLLQDILASTKKDLASTKKDLEDYKKDIAHYEERVRLLEADILHTIEKMQNYVQDFQNIKKYISELEERLEEQKKLRESQILRMLTIFHYMKRKSVRKASRVSGPHNPNLVQE